MLRLLHSSRPTCQSGFAILGVQKFANIDLHPDVVSKTQMGTVFEELIRKFAELSNETAGEHMSPREVIRLMVNLLFVEDSDILSKPGVVRSLYDPTVDRRHVVRRGRTSWRNEPRCSARDVRTGAQRGIVRDLQSGHADQRA